MLEKIILKKLKSPFPKIIGGSQAPLIDGDNVWATTRDDKNRSHPTLLGGIKYFPGAFSRFFLLGGSENIVYEFLGKKGSFNSQGNMLSQILPDGSFSLTCWTLGADDESTSRNCLATCSYPNSVKPIHLDDLESVSTSMAFLDHDQNTMYYMSYYGWYNKEAIYGIKSCKYRIDDGKTEYYDFNWILRGQYCYARPVIREHNGIKELWYSYRDFGKRNYKAGCSRMLNGTWFPVEVESEDEIVAYPYPFTVEGVSYVLYNNDDLLRGQIQIAELHYGT